MFDPSIHNIYVYIQQKIHIFIYKEDLNKSLWLIEFIFKLTLLTDKFENIAPSANINVTMTSQNNLYYTAMSILATVPESYMKAVHYQHVNCLANTRGSVQ